MNEDHSSIHNKFILNIDSYYALTKVFTYNRQINPTMFLRTPWAYIFCEGFPYGMECAKYDPAFMIIVVDLNITLKCLVLRGVFIC